MLVRHFLKHLAKTASLPACDIAEDALMVLETLEWPGNVQQLGNSIERLLILTQVEEGEIITADRLPPDITSMSPTLPTQVDTHLLTMPIKEAREAFETHYLMAQLLRFGGNISKTAAFVEMERSALHRKLKQLDIALDREKQELS